MLTIQLKSHLTEQCSVLCHRPMMNTADVILCTWTVVCNHLWYICDTGCHQSHYWKRGSTIFLACKAVPLQWMKMTMQHSNLPIYFIPHHWLQMSRIPSPGQTTTISTSFHIKRLCWTVGEAVYLKCSRLFLPPFPVSWLCTFVM